MKPAAKRTNQQKNMCKQALHRTIESKIAADACLASDLYHYMDDNDSEEDLWGDTAAARYVLNTIQSQRSHNIVYPITSTQ